MPSVSTQLLISYNHSPPLHPLTSRRFPPTSSRQYLSRCCPCLGEVASRVVRCLKCQQHAHSTHSTRHCIAEAAPSKSVLHTAAAAPQQQHPHSSSAPTAAAPKSRPYQSKSSSLPSSASSLQCRFPSYVVPLHFHLIDASGDALVIQFTPGEVCGPTVAASCSGGGRRAARGCGQPAAAAATRRLQ